MLRVELTEPHSSQPPGAGDFHTVCATCTPASGFADVDAGLPTALRGVKMASSVLRAEPPTTGNLAYERGAAAGVGETAVGAFRTLFYPRTTSPTMLQSIPDVPDWALGTVVGAVWAVVLAVTVYKYRAGTRSRRRFYTTICVGSIWLAYSLLQISTAVSGAAEIAVVALAIGCVPVGIVAGVRWRRSGGPDGERDATA